jgi:hypothetical protein
MSIDKPNPTGLATQVPAPLGLAEFDREMKEQGRVVLPLLKIIQSMSDDFIKEKVPVGVFRNTLSGEVIGESLEVIPIGVKHYRRRFVDRNVLCYSNNALDGVGDPGGSCLACPLSKWEVEDSHGTRWLIEKGIANYRTKVGEKLTPPPCQEQWVFPCLELKSAWRVPGAVIFSKSSYGEGLNFGYMLRNAPFDTVYKISTEQQTGKLGTWYSPKVSLLRKATPEESNMILKLRENLEHTVFEVAGVDDSAQ